ncbi:MAG: hypothetical protein Kow0069_02610 [Promethearchaeota archaeon]
MTPNERPVLVVGAGIAGIQAALDLGDMGIPVHLLEKNACIGGRMAQLDKTFPTNDCSICILAPKLSECFRHPMITLHTLAELQRLEGSPGQFVAHVVQRPRYVKEDACINCGDCVKKCPSRVDDPFNQGLNKRKAIGLDYLQGIPAVMAIDAEHCLYLTKGVCRMCQKVCPKEAIDFEQKEKHLTLEVGAVILATGYDPFDPSGIHKYGYGRVANVITAMELERLICASGPTGGHLQRPSDGGLVRNLAFIQCVGSRDATTNNYCSSICCMYTTKESMIAHEHDNELRTKIFYIDRRAGGKNFREYLDRGEEEYRITYVQGKVGEVREDEDKNPVLVYEDVANGKVLEEKFDLVVLATSVVTRPETLALAEALGLDRDAFNFLLTSPEEPMRTSREGVFACGSCHEPMDIPCSVVEASGAAALAAEVVRNGGAAR